MKLARLMVQSNALSERALVRDNRRQGKANTYLDVHFLGGNLFTVGEAGNHTKASYTTKAHIILLEI